MMIYLITKLLLVALEQDMSSTESLIEYGNFENVFSSQFAKELPHYTRVNKYTIKLVEDKLPSPDPISTPSLVQLGIFKTYRETYIKIEFIRSSKFFIRVLILFHKKLDRRLCLFVN